MKTDWKSMSMPVYKPFRYSFAALEKHLINLVYNEINWPIEDQIFGEIQECLWDDINTWSEDV